MASSFYVSSIFLLVPELHFSFCERYLDKHFCMRTATLAFVFLAVGCYAAPTKRALVADDPSRFTFYPSLTPLSARCDLCQGSDGALWGQDLLNNLITRLDPNTGVLTEYTIPYNNNSAGTLQSLEPEILALSCAIQPGQDGMLYAAAGIRSQFLQINPVSKEIRVFTPPYPNSILGNLQFL